MQAFPHTQLPYSQSHFQKGSKHEQMLQDTITKRKNRKKKAQQDIKSIQHGVNRHLIRTRIASFKVCTQKDIPPPYRNKNIYYGQLAISS